jgi:DNA-binding ferritin-like protein (oxidative damage protectant)
MKIDIGIDESARLATVTALERVLADTYTLYLKTHNFHWNVTGPKFNDLHAMFMGQYTEMWAAVDVIASASARSALRPGSTGTSPASARARATACPSHENVASCRARASSHLAPLSREAATTVTSTATTVRSKKTAGSGTAH